MNCGGLTVSTGDLIVADEEGIVVVPQAQIETVLTTALQKRDKAATKSLEQWRASHEKKIQQILV